ncbi:MAG TPA: PQQ-binding-like beta-propeller repeat protein [Actinomycetota bacterium]|nr:PQQ-binding-like beta-propeller repeat protein [Actinomycetota bacterium]
MAHRDLRARFRARTAAIIVVGAAVSAVSWPARAAAPTITGSSHSGGRLATTATVKTTPKVGPPRTPVTVNGSGFAASEPVDLYFDTTDLALAIAGADGTFGGMTIRVPATAEPGAHWISAVGRRSGTGSQMSFVVRTNWPQRGRVARHAGSNPTENLIDPGTVPDLEEAWHGVTGGDVLSSPAVADGVVYVGSDDHNLYAFPASCGTGGAVCSPRWHGTTGSFVESSPAVAGGAVYVGSSDGNLYAFPASCGNGNASCSPLWHGTTGAAVTSSPAVAGTAVYVGSSDGNLYAFPASCGSGNASCSPLWHGTTGGAISSSSPAVANGTVFVGSSDGSLYAFPASCGTGNAVCSPLWHGLVHGPVLSSPAVVNGKVFMGSGDGNLYAFPASCGTGNATCAPLWHAATGGIMESSPAVSNGVVYVGSNDGNLYAFPAACGTGNATCTPLWHGATGGAVESSPAVAGGVVIVGSDSDSVFAFPAACGSANASCQALWSSPTGDSVPSSPAVADGVVYVGSDDRRLYAFDLVSGAAGVQRPSLADLRPVATLEVRTWQPRQARIELCVGRLLIHIAQGGGTSHLAGSVAPGSRTSLDGLVQALADTAADPWEAPTYQRRTPGTRPLTCHGNEYTAVLHLVRRCLHAIRLGPIPRAQPRQRRVSG